MDSSHRKNALFGNLMLFSCAIIWGFALVAQRKASNTMQAFSFNAMRYFFATLVLGISVLAVELVGKKTGNRPEKFNKSTILGGILCGVSLFFGNNMQQIGVAMTSVGKASFITVMYIVLVPVIGLLRNKKPTAKVCYAIFVSVVGFFLMSLSEGQSIVLGDVIVLFGAIMIAFQIVFIDTYVSECDPFKLTFVQFVVAAVMSVPAMAIEGFPSVDVLNENIISILYVGILSAGLAFTFQTIGQRHTEPTTASLIMSLESIVGMIGGVIFFKEIYTVKELLGCMLVLLAVIVVQIPFGKVKHFEITKAKLKANDYGKTSHKLAYQE